MKNEAGALTCYVVKRIFFVDLLKIYGQKLLNVSHSQEEKGNCNPKDEHSAQNSERGRERSTAGIIFLRFKF